MLSVSSLLFFCLSCCSLSLFGLRWMHIASKTMAGFGIFVKFFAASISLFNIARRLVYAISAHGTAKYQMALVMGYMGFLFSFDFITERVVGGHVAQGFSGTGAHGGYFCRQHSWKASARGRLLGAQLLWRQCIDFLT